MKQRTPSGLCRAGHPIRGETSMTRFGFGVTFDDEKLQTTLAAKPFSRLRRRSAARKTESSESAPNTAKGGTRPAQGEQRWKI